MPRLTKSSLVVFILSVSYCFNTRINPLCFRSQSRSNREQCSTRASDWYRELVSVSFLFRSFIEINCQLFYPSFFIVMPEIKLTLSTYYNLSPENFTSNFFLDLEYLPQSSPGRSEDFHQHAAAL